MLYDETLYYKLIFVLILFYPILILILFLFYYIV